MILCIIQVSRGICPHVYGRDTYSYIFKHCVIADHQFTSCDHLIVGSNYCNNKQKWKIAEALLIKNLKPSLNVQEE